MSRMLTAVFSFILCLIFDVSRANSNYTGLLTQQCVSNYLRIFITKQVPQRDYLYYHESLSLHKGDVSHNRRNDIKNWINRNERDDIRYRIVGGTKTTIIDLPYQVLYGEYCGGTLIAPDWVITAAHCKTRDTFIMAGSTFRSQATRYPICAHFVHPAWEAKDKQHMHDYDFQLLLLSRPVPVTPASRPIAIASFGCLEEGTLLTVSGWGHLHYKKSQMQDILHKVEVPTISSEECQTMPDKNYANLTDRMFCAGFFNGNKDSCQGDSGGPAVHNGRLVGMVSFGVGCAMKERPGVYSYIPAVRGWIRSVTALPL